MTKLISIISEGHSGSTLCDILIGTIPGVFSTGECVYFPWQLHRDGKVCKLGQDICSCGKKFSKCPAWTQIIHKLNKIVGYDIYQDPFRFEMAMYSNQVYGKPIRVYDRILRAVFVRLLRHSHFPLANKFFSSHVQRQLENNWLFFDAIGKTMAISHVVDSSKNIIRMKLLHQKRPQDVYLILLLRDIEGVAASAAKRGCSPLKGASEWIQFYRNCLQILTKARDIKMLLVNYEGMVNDPEQIRNKIANFIGLPPPQNPLAIDTKNHHLVAGNPMRYKGKIPIKYDDSWKQVLSPDVKNKLYAMKNEYEAIVAGIKTLNEEKTVNNML